MNRNYEDMRLDELGDSISDYHKDVYGFRPRHEGMYQDREMLIRLWRSMDTHMDTMKSTFEGRELLREEGWYIPETDSKCIAKAAISDTQRAIRRAAYEAGDKRLQFSSIGETK